MNASKCYQLLLLFDKKDRNHFENFVESSFFNKDKSVIRLYQWLRKYLEHPVQKSLRAETAYRYIFPKKKASETLDTKAAQDLNRLLSKLYELAVDFIRWKKLKTHKAYGEHIVLQEFLDKRASKLFELHFNKHYKNKSKPEKIDIDTYYDLFLLEYDYARWNLQQKNHFQKNDNFQNVSDKLTLYYLTRQLDLVCQILILTRQYKMPYNLDHLPHLLSIAELPRFNSEPLLQIYLQAIYIMREEQAVHFEQLKQLLILHEADISYKVQSDMYILATNFCTLRIIAGESNYLEELFGLYQTMSEKNLLIEGEYIPIDKMKNVVSVGCKLRHFDWTRELIESNLKRIAPNVRDSVYHFGMGAIAFYQNDQDYSERTERIILSFLAYIKQNRVLSAINKQGYINFTKTLHSLYRIKHHVGKRPLKFVENRLNNYERTNDKKWLLEKIKVLKVVL